MSVEIALLPINGLLEEQRGCSYEAGLVLCLQYEWRSQTHRWELC